MAWIASSNGAVHVGGKWHVATGDEVVHKGGGKLGWWVFVASNKKKPKKRVGSIKCWAMS